MIGALKGLVDEVATDSAVIDVGGVGYLVQLSSRTLGRLAVGDAIRLRVETQVREDAITLYGFLDNVEREWFRLLTGVQGVGGRVGLSILGALSTEEIALAIATQDKAMLSRAPGIGPRLATRLVTELKGKEVVGTSAALAGDATAPAATGGLMQEAISALLNLGFREAQAARAVSEALRSAREDDGSEMDLGALIREALKRAGR